jgi:O-antigen ligase
MDGWLSASPSVWLFGFPFGKGYARMHFGVMVDFAPHNFYVDLLLRVGIVGMLLWILPTVMVIVHSLRARCESEAEYLWTRGLAVMLLAVMVYCIVYPSNYLAGAATGIGISEMIRRSHRRTALGHSAAPRAAVMTGALHGSMPWRADR